MKLQTLTKYVLCSAVIIYRLLIPAVSIYAQNQEAGRAAMLAYTKSEDYTNDPRVITLRQYFLSKHSPLANDARNFIEIADMYNVNWKLVPAIAGLESSYGIHIPTGSYNAWGWGVFTGQQSGASFTSWKEGIEEVTKGLRLRYINKGAITIEQIGSIYASSPTWAVRVSIIMDDIEAFIPNNPLAIHITL